MNLFYHFCRLLSFFFCTICFQLRFFGSSRVPKRGGVLIVSNHQSLLDPVLVGVSTLRPIHFVAKDTLFKSLLGVLIRNLNAFPIKRGGGDQEAVREGISRLKAGHPLLLFPEGTRTQDGSIGRIRKGAARIAKEAEVPIIPARIIGAFEAWPRQKRFPTSYPIRVFWGKPIPYQEYKDVEYEVICQKIEGIIRSLGPR